MNFGCRLNSYEGEVIRRQAEAAGLAALDGGAVILNTCAVTGEAVRQAKQAIRRARRENPGARIIVTGCAAQTAPQDFAVMAEVDLVIGNDDKLKAQSYRALPDFGVNDMEKARVNDIFEVTDIAPQMVDSVEGRARAFLQVQNGCDHRCTFCIIPYGRGNARSVPMGAAVDEVKRLADKGFNEVVLTGVDLTSYGPDLPGSPRLGGLVQAILAGVPQLKRLRLSSIDSIEADDALIEAISSEARLMPHLHLSLQHGADIILKRMKRRHLRDDSLRFTEMIRSRRPDIAFGADLIAGFPTETDAHFEDLLSLIDACGISYVHAFPFSPREGTPAALMPQLDRAVVKERAARLRAKGDAVFAAHLARMAAPRAAEVLVERGGGAQATARLADFTPVRINGTAAAGAIITVDITGHDGRMLVADPHRQ
ncbi:MAG: tRNA (N(6)-L-threonylcarbamoyladenosine(37)-C(2))-methylthiotransferase MtaB [Rhizobiaceae bacterium]|nr:tRNA (N(6)-L-threonylcarbamoyladenosine(37)-C(2))-methylthiotransferase MtaB [Rhizobiaceae bacterium]